MARYEGMDDLLQLVGERLGAVDDGFGTSGGCGDLGIPSVEYETALNRILIVLHEAEGLRQVLQGREYHDLPVDQIEDLLGVLDKVQREVRRCEAELQR